MLSSFIYRVLKNKTRLLYVLNKFYLIYSSSLGPQKCMSCLMHSTNLKQSVMVSHRTTKIHYNYFMTSGRRNYVKHKLLQILHLFLQSSSWNFNDMNYSSIYTFSIFYETTCIYVRKTVLCLFSFQHCFFYLSNRCMRQEANLQSRVFSAFIYGIIFRHLPLKLVILEG